MGSRNHIIATSTEFEIGTGGDYASLNTALDDLMYYHIDYAATVTLKLIAGFTPVNFVQYHPQGRNIIIDLNGQDYNIASGEAFKADYGAMLRITNSGASATISTDDNGAGNGLVAVRNGAVSVEIDALGDIIVGASGSGFSSGVYANSGRVFAAYVQAQYNTRGVYSILGGYASLSSGQANNNTTGLHAVRGSYIEASSVTLSSNTANANPAVNTDGNQNSYIYWTAP